jgi:hypothetical protein
MALRCKFGHNHPPEPLKAATRNPSRRGARPYHCPECSEIRKPQAVDANWLTYPDVATAELRGHPRPCSLCFPGEGSGAATVRAALQPGGRARASTADPVLTPIVTADELTTWRRQLLRILDALEGPTERSGLGPAARVTRLRSAGRIPRDTAAQMLLVTEARNVAEYEDRSQTAAGAEAARSAWVAVRDWARAQGIVIGSR